MSDRLKSLEFQRLFQEYTFLDIDEEYKKEFINENSHKFNEAIRKLLSEDQSLKDSLFPKSEPTENVEEIESVESEEIKGLLNSAEPNFYSLEWLLNTKDHGEIVMYSASSESYDNKKEETKKKVKEDKKTPDSIEKAKALFRKIAKKTHPDKTKTNQLSDFYIKAKAAYELCDILELYSICIKLGISYEIKDCEKEDIQIKINTKKEEINRLEMSFIWLWASSFDDDYKKALLNSFLIQEGHKHRSFFCM